MFEYEIRDKWKYDKNLYEVDFSFYSDCCSLEEYGRTMTNIQKVRFVMLLPDRNFMPLFRFLYSYIAELRDKHLSIIQAKAKEQYMEYPQVFDKLFEEERAYFSTRLNISFDIGAFQRELMRQ